jgi:aldose 1-epimerase
MAHTVRTRQAEGVTGLDPTLYVLEDGAGGVAEVWPALGFNCVRWRAVRADQVLELLYSDPALFQGARPTRSGIPVLFPFPNRIRDGRFSFAGQSYQLPLNDPAQKNAIHGFACRVPWRVVDQGADTMSAWVTGEFRCSVDAPTSLPLWPADHEIRLTVRLGRGTLRLEAVVSNPDTKPLPWGLGYHPYFRLPFAGGGSAEDCTVEVPAKEFWVLEGNLPTGERRPVDDKRDLNRPRRVGELALDDVLTGLPARPARMDGLLNRAAITGAPGGPLRMFCSGEFRELVVFTPPHRQAFCVEPYTCTTDAANRTDGGWAVLPPGGTASLVVELWV